MQAFRVNPVMLKELRGRMRGVRAFAVMTVYLGLMSGFTTLLYLVYSSFTRTSGSAAAGEIGRVLFLGVVGIELLLIIFIAPAFTAGAITGERERQTYDLLQTTLLATPSFVIGKLESALGYILLLLLSGIPLQSIAFLFGGVSELELVLSFVILMVTAIALGTVGIYFSAAMPRTLVASVRAYSVILGAMFVAPVLLSGVLNVINDLLFSRTGAVDLADSGDDRPLSRSAADQRQPDCGGAVGAGFAGQPARARLLVVYAAQRRQHHSDGLALDHVHDHLSGGFRRADRPDDPQHQRECHLKRNFGRMIRVDTCTDRTEDTLSWVSPSRGTMRNRRFCG